VGCCDALDVVAGLDLAIHEASQVIRAARIFNLRLIMDARVKPAHVLYISGVPLITALPAHR
jgi:hypothetical protein